MYLAVLFEGCHCDLASQFNHFGFVVGSTRTGAAAGFVFTATSSVFAAAAVPAFRDGHHDLSAAIAS
jgi:hypothetical protein